MDKGKKKRIKHYKQCPICDKVFISNRRDAKYCSNACKVYAHRRRKDPLLKDPTVRIVLEISTRAYDILETKAEAIGEDPRLFLENMLEDGNSRSVEIRFSDVEHIRIKSLFTAVDTSRTWGENLKKWVVEQTKREDIASVKQTLRKL